MKDCLHWTFDRILMHGRNRLGCGNSVIDVEVPATDPWTGEPDGRGRYAIREVKGGYAVAYLSRGSDDPLYVMYARPRVIGWEEAVGYRPFDAKTAIHYTLFGTYKPDLQMEMHRDASRIMVALYRLEGRGDVAMADLAARGIDLSEPVAAAS